MNESTDHIKPGLQTSHRYLAPGWFTRNVFNRTVAWLTRRGFGPFGARELRVVGRRTGDVRATVVNVLAVGDRRYLVSPRGHTHWVRNLRAVGAGELRLGRRVERFTSAELAADDKAPVLHAYLERWGWEVGQFFEGLDRHATAEDLSAVAGDFPVFSLDTAG